MSTTDSRGEASEPSFSASGLSGLQAAVQWMLEGHAATREIAQAMRTYTSRKREAMRLKSEGGDPEQMHDEIIVPAMHALAGTLERRAGDINVGGVEAQLEVVRTLTPGATAGVPRELLMILRGVIEGFMENVSETAATLGRFVESVEAQTSITAKEAAAVERLLPPARKTQRYFEHTASASETLITHLRSL